VCRNGLIVIIICTSNGKQHFYATMESSKLAESQYLSSTNNLTTRIAIHAYSTNPTPWFTWLSSRLTVSGDVLEIGAGTGELWKHVDHSNAKLTLTDFSPAMVTQLQSLEIPGAAVMQCNAASLPFNDASFDCAIANHMMYHVDNPDAVLKELIRVLRPNGRLYVSLNGREHVAELSTLAESMGRPMGLKSAGMTADNGKEYIERYFVDVGIEQFPGNLAIPSPEPVLAYLGTLGDSGPLTSQQSSAARKVIEDEIAANGSFKVRKHTALVIARREI